MKKKKLEDIGKNGSPDDISDALRNIAGQPQQSKQSLFFKGDLFYQRALGVMYGALERLRDGDAANAARFFAVVPPHPLYKEDVTDFFLAKALLNAPYTIKRHLTAAEVCDMLAATPDRQKTLDNALQLLCLWSQGDTTTPTDAISILCAAGANVKTTFEWVENKDIRFDMNMVMADNYRSHGIRHLHDLGLPITQSVALARRARRLAPHSGRMLNILKQLENAHVDITGQTYNTACDTQAEPAPAHNAPVVFRPKKGAP